MRLTLRWREFRSGAAGTRRRFGRAVFLLAALLVAAALAGSPAAAQSIEQRVAQNLIEQGYDTVRIRRTWLGRSRIIAEDGRRRREIVIEPSSGLILRDYFWIVDADGARRPGLLNGDDDGRGAGGDAGLPGAYDDDDHDDDDRDRDDRDDDRGDDDDGGRDREDRDDDD